MVSINFYENFKFLKRIFVYKNCFFLEIKNKSRHQWQQQFLFKIQNFLTFKKKIFKLAGHFKHTQESKCLQERRLALSRPLDVTMSSYIPQCTLEGAFKDVQCHLATGNIIKTESYFKTKWRKIFFWEDISSFCGATDTPVFNFWWRLLWVLKPGWAALFTLGGGIHVSHSLRFTSGATPADHLVKFVLGFKSRVDSLACILLTCVQWIPQIHLWCYTIKTKGHSKK